MPPRSKQQQNQTAASEEQDSSLKDNNPDALTSSSIEEVRSYWQVASITHFCTLFGKQFKLPAFEPEELEHAFITDIPSPKRDDDDDDDDDDEEKGEEGRQEDYDSNVKREYNIKTSLDYDDSADYSPYQSIRNNHINNEVATNGTTKITPSQPDLHLLLKLAIPLLRPHFNCKICHENWERFLLRLLDAYWVQLEQYPCPLRVPSVTDDGIEMTETITFNELRLSDKIEIFNALCDYRLWCDDAADAIKDFPLEELRLESIGKDAKGFEYWYFSGTRLFRGKRELMDNIALREQQIAKLNYKIIELRKSNIIKEKEEREKAELERAKREALEERERKLEKKRQEEQEAKRKRQLKTTPLPPRTGLRERRSSAINNTNSNLRSSTPSKQTRQSSTATSTTKATRSSTTKSNGSKKESQAQKLEPPNLDTEEAVLDEIDKLSVALNERQMSWRKQCESLEEWEEFATRFTNTKSTNERYLSAMLNEEILPKIRSIYTKRINEARRKEKELIFSSACRRTSSRIICKRAQEEEEERKALIQERELKRKKLEAEVRLKAELEREMRSRMNKTLFTESQPIETNGEDSRYSFRGQASYEFDGIIHPDKMAEFYEAIELVIDIVRTNKHAWPFIDPVPKTVPNYYDLITEPMDLKKMRNKIDFREYKSLLELEEDFKLIINNCEKFNGPTNVYTRMAYKLWKVFRKNILIFLQRDLNMDEYETFLHPPERPPAQPISREEKPQDSDQQCMTDFPKLDQVPINDSPELKQEVQTTDFTGLHKVQVTDSSEPEQVPAKDFPELQQVQTGNSIEVELVPAKDFPELQQVQTGNSIEVELVPAKDFPELQQVETGNSIEVELVPTSDFPELQQVQASDFPKLEQVENSEFPELEQVQTSDFPELEQVQTNSCES